MIDVKGRWALVTGASRGIGFLAAVELAARGCNLILHARSEAHLQKALEAAKSHGVTALPAVCELSSPDAVADMLARVDSLGVPVDIVLNNAGVQVAYRTEYLSTPASDYEKSFLINTIAPMMIACHFLPGMVKRGFGRIVNTTSGIRHEPEQAGYSASKAALDKVTVDLALAYDGTDVLINLTDPGWCRTDLGGPNALNAPESAVPGVIVGVFVNDKKSARCFCAQDYSGMTLEAAVEHAEKHVPKYTGTIG